MALNTSSINSRTINTAGGILITGVGEILTFEQVVRVSGSGLILSFEQTIDLRISEEGSILTFEQSIETSAEGLILSFEQSIFNVSNPSFYSRNGWYPIITIDGSRVSDSMLRGVWSYRHNESNSALLDFNIQPSIGIQDIYQYQGKTVTCDIRTSAGIHRIFTGIIDIPVIDVMNEWITLKCADNREERLNSGQVAPSAVGYYSTSVFGTALDNKTQLLNRLTTVTSSLDWDGYGTPYLTPWTPASSAHYTLSDGFVYRREPAIRIESRAQIINQVNINFTYSYQRFHTGHASFSWAKNYSNAYFLQFSPTMLKRDMVSAAVEQAGWDLLGDIAFTDILQAGIYNINGIPVIWSTTQSSYKVVPVTSNNPTPGGDPVPVVGDDGKQIFTSVPTSSVDLTKIYCFGAAWNCVKRWSQNVEENYTLTVSAHQSISRYGLKEEEQKTSFTDIDNSNSWDNTPYAPIAGYATPSYVDQNLTLSEYINATNTLLNQAKAKIISTHRDSRCSFERSIWPQIDLRHTVALSTTRIDCRGKVVGIYHEMNFGTGDAFTEIDLALFRATGSQAETTITAPARPTDSLIPFAGSYALQSHYGVDPSAPDAVNWNGHIGNKYIKERVANGFNTRRTEYRESFIVDTPAIPSNYRDTRTLTAAASYNVSIPDNTLVWTTIGK